jgi:DNA-binding LytR/AlgR family response regulator
MKITCLLVDDVKLNQQTLLDLTADFDFLQSIGVAGNAQEAATALRELEPDVMFLDIEMPGLSGLDLLKSLPDPPLTIITTSHKEFAVESYEMKVFDYLVKPISRERFAKTAERLSEHFRKNKKPSLADQFFMKVGNKYVRVRYAEIKFIEAMRDFVVVYLDHTKLATMQTLKSFTSQLPEGRFIRVHRSYVVPIARIDAIEGNMVRVQDQLIPISDSHKNMVMKILLEG